MIFSAALKNTVPDTLKQVGHEEDNWIIHHILDQPLINIPPIQIGGITLDLSISKNVLMMMVTAVLLISILTLAARSNAKNRAPKGFGNLVEMIIVFLRDEVVIPSMGKAGIKFLPFFFTLFFFILTCNFLGMVPFMSTATGSVSITAGLAIITFIMTQAQGIRNNGLLGYFKGLIPPGVPVFVLPVMIIVEFLGLLTKPFALCIRLFANMTAGHVVILALIGLIFSLGYAATPVSIVFALFIYVLEILVGLLQAFIFTMLSALFIGMAVHQEH
jgi:F-type H+-transporting ATPase subunit a